MNEPTYLRVTLRELLNVTADVIRDVYPEYGESTWHPEDLCAAIVTTVPAIAVGMVRGADLMRSQAVAPTVRAEGLDPL